MFQFFRKRTNKPDGDTSNLIIHFSLRRLQKIMGWNGLRHQPLRPITIHHHSPLPTQNRDYHPAKAKIYSYITSFWYWFNWVFSTKCNIPFRDRDFAWSSFDQFVFINSNFYYILRYLRLFTFYDFLRFIFQELKVTRFIFICFYKWGSYAYLLLEG